jgi:hypothetical protein
MKRFAVLAAAVTAVLVGLTAAAAQAGAAQHAAQTATTTTGNDVSWPQCGKTLPSGQAFGIVGVNGGKANNVNSCFAAEWQWATRSTGAAHQAPSQLYVNTGNPGDVLAQYNITDWPQSAVGADPYGSCAGGDDTACSWEYGYERAQADVATVTGAGVSAARPWWLDIETSNSWTADPAKNQASLEGMVYELQSQGGTVGIYSSSTSWSSLFGPVTSSSTLYQLPEWRPGAKSLRAAQGNCSLQPFEGTGKVTLTQYVSNNLDYDYSCV